MTTITALREILTMMVDQGHDSFDLIWLTQEVRRWTGRYVTDGTVSRELRMLRESHFDIVCTERHKSRYKFSELYRGPA